VLLEFLRQVRHLDDRLGPLLFQLPPSLAFDLEVARRFLDLLREHHLGQVVWEPRHATWFDVQVELLLREYKITRVAADPACVPAAGMPGGDESLAYFRLHGSPRVYYSSYSDEFLDSLAVQLVGLAAAAPACCVFDNTALGFAAENGLALKRKVT
jgi:uncharacterized protein YecE (DUF72 family)